MGETYKYYSLSGKKRFSFEQVAAALHEKRPSRGPETKG